MNAKTVVILFSAAAMLAATPAESRIVQAKSAVARNFAFPEAYAALAVALTERARETANAMFTGQAREAVQEALRLDPANFTARKAEISVLLEERDFAFALEKAKALNRRVPDDVAVYGFITDAAVALGRYAEAEKACQWMLNLRRGNAPALERVGTLRELFGDLEGALMAFDMALQATPMTETSERAWIVTQEGRVKFEQAKMDAAGQTLEAALKLVPGYPYALDALARIRAAQKRYGEAVALAQQLYAASPTSPHLFVLAEALDRAGKSEEAAQAFAQFEAEALSKLDTRWNGNLELAAYYLDPASKPEQALRIAQHEFETRHDVKTLDVYARALNANGRRAEARKIMDQALSVGVRDPEILSHAGALSASARK